MNSLAERRNQIFCLRRGKPTKQKVKGTGRYKAFTPGTMLTSTFLCFFESCKICFCCLHCFGDLLTILSSTCGSVTFFGVWMNRETLTCLEPSASSFMSEACAFILEVWQTATNFSYPC